MRAALLSLVLIGIGGPCAHADPLEDFDPAPLAACAAEADGAALRTCVGAAAGPCIARGGGATMSEALCWSYEGEWWAARAREVETRLMERDPPRARALGHASGSFNLFADNECAYRGATFDGGSGAQPAMARCAAELWAERTIMLLETERAY